MSMSFLYKLLQPFDRVRIERSIADLRNPDITRLNDLLRTTGRRSGMPVGRTFPYHSLLQTIEYLNYERTAPSEVASNDCTSRWPVSQLRYRIFSDHVGHTVTLTVVFLGTNTWEQMVTDVNIVESSLELGLNGQSYHISIYNGIYTSLFGSHCAPVGEVMSELEKQMCKHPDGAAGKWRLRLGGHSLGTTQILYFLCWYLSDATQATYPTVASNRFKSIQCFLIASVVGTRCDELAAYIEAMQRHNRTLSLCSVVHVMDIFNRAIMNLVLTRHAIAEQMLLDTENGRAVLHRVPSILIGNGLISKSACLLSYFDPKSFVYMANAIAHSTLNHFLEAYKAGIESIIAHKGADSGRRSPRHAKAVFKALA